MVWGCFIYVCIFRTINLYFIINTSGPSSSVKVVLQRYFFSLCITMNTDKRLKPKIGLEPKKKIYNKKLTFEGIF